MSAQDHTLNKLSRRDFLKLIGLGAGATYLASCTPRSQATVTPAATEPPASVARFRICFNVEYQTNPDLNPLVAGQFDSTRGLTGELVAHQGYQTFTFTVADLRSALGEGNSELQSLGVIPDGATFDFDMWVSVNGWPRDVNVLWVSGLQVGNIPLLTAVSQRDFTFKSFFQTYDDMYSPIFPFGTYSTNAIRNAAEGVDGGPCVKYTIAGAAGASWIIFKEPVDLSGLADTDTFQISMKLGRNTYEKWSPAPVAAAAPVPPPTFEIGPGKQYENISDMPWEELQAGDVVYIYWREEPYQEKFGLDVQGTADRPVYIHGVPGPENQLPVIDGNHAVTRPAMPIAGQNNRLVSLGNNERATTYVVIENLEICNANKFKMYYPKDQTTLKPYNEFSAGLYVHRGEHITIRNCTIHHCANGLFVNSFSNLDYYSEKPILETETQYASSDILVEGNYFYQNGVAGKMFEHHSYSAAICTTYQFNHYGPLLNGSTGYALKDRGAGTVIRYNWIEDGRRQISLDDGQDCPLIVFDPQYIDSYVYGNILIEPDGGFRVWGDDEIVHFGGDDENVLDRIGTLYFTNNTVVTYRTRETYTKYTTASWAAGREPRTCLLYLPVRDQTVEATNNIFHRVGDAPLTIMNDGGTDVPSGAVLLSHNWFTDGWVDKMEGTGRVTDDGSNLTGVEPGFVDLVNQDFRLSPGSPCVNSGVVTEISPEFEYVLHQLGAARSSDGKIDLGAYETLP